MTSLSALAPSTTVTGAAAGAFDALAFLTLSMILATSPRNFASSVWMPLRNVLQWRVMAAIATASPISASLAPFSLANSVCAMMQ